MQAQRAEDQNLGGMGMQGRIAIKWRIKSFVFWIILSHGCWESQRYVYECGNRGFYTGRSFSKDGCYNSCQFGFYANPNNSNIFLNKFRYHELHIEFRFAKLFHQRAIAEILHWNVFKSIIKEIHIDDNACWNVIYSNKFAVAFHIAFRHWIFNTQEFITIRWRIHNVKAMEGLPARAHSAFFSMNLANTDFQRSIHVCMISAFAHKSRTFHVIRQRWS